MTKKFVLFCLMALLIVSGLSISAYYIQRIPVGYEKTPAVQLYEKEIVAIKANSEYDNMSVKADKKLCDEIIADGTFDIFKSIEYSGRSKENFSKDSGWTEIEVIFSDDTVLFIRPCGEIINLNRKFYYTDKQLHGFAETLYTRIKKDGNRI